MRASGLFFLGCFLSSILPVQAAAPYVAWQRNIAAFDATALLPDPYRRIAVAGATSNGAGAVLLGANGEFVSSIGVCLPTNAAPFEPRIVGDQAGRIFFLWSAPDAQCLAIDTGLSSVSCLGGGWSYDSYRSAIPDESGGVYVGMDSPSFRGKHIDYFSPGNEPRGFQSSLTGDSREALVARAPSGQVYLVGSQGWSRYAPLRVIAYEANGALLWDRRFDGPTNEFATAVACDSRGNLFIAGMHRDQGGPGPGDFDPMLIKLSSSGGFMWRAVIRNAPFGVHTSIAVNSSDDVLVGGPNGLFKYSNSGQEIWHNPEAITYLRLTRGNEIVTVGNGETVVLQKRSNRGEEIWRTELSAEESFGNVAVDDQGSAYVSTVKWFYPEGPVRPIPIRSMVRKYVDEPVAFELKGTLEPPVLSYCETAGPCGNPAPVPPAAVNAARISPGKLLVCWPTNYGDYQLESTRRVNRRHPERTKWRPVLESVATNAESLCVTVKVARTGKFFRIVQPQGAD